MGGHGSSPPFGVESRHTVRPGSGMSNKDDESTLSGRLVRQRPGLRSAALHVVCRAYGARAASANHPQTRRLFPCTRTIIKPSRATSSSSWQ